MFQMKRFFKLFFFALAFPFFVACKKDKTLDISGITLKTLTPEVNFTNFHIDVTAEISPEVPKNITFGFCYNNVPNPKIQDITTTVVDITGKKFSGIVEFIENGGIIYIRSFVRDNKNGEVVYGNQVQIDLWQYLKIKEIRDITHYGMTVDIQTIGNIPVSSTLGYCYSFSPNPTRELNNTMASPTSGSGTFSLTHPYLFTARLSPAETYYIRPFIYHNGVVLYGEQKNFRTTGYVGQGNGLVFFDKGKVTDGWRYLETANKSLEDGEFYNWACNQSFISTSVDIGSGYQNSVSIRNVCNFTNVAAAMALYLPFNNKNDWFLPSLEELKILALFNKDVMNKALRFEHWSSTQANNSSAYVVNMENNEVNTLSKLNFKYAVQIRRY